jgi:hypothetical protein
MNWDAVKNAVGSIAPFLASTLGGSLAGTAVKTLCGVLGLIDTKKQTPDAVLEALHDATPEQLLELKKAEAAHVEFMSKLGFDSIEKLEAIAAGDRSNARARENAVRDHTPRNLVYILSAGFFSCLFALMFLVVPDTNKAIIFSMVGSLGTCWLSSVAYFFGTTASSAHKTDLIAQAEPVELK